MKNELRIKLPEKFNEPMDRGFLCVNDMVDFLIGSGVFTSDKPIEKTAIKDLTYMDMYSIEYAYIEFEDSLWKLVLGIYEE